MWRRRRGSKKHRAKIENWTRARLRKIEESEPPEYFDFGLPELRREIIIKDYDFQGISHHFKLYKSDRIDCYFVEVDGQIIKDRQGKKRRIGWSKAIELCRKAFVRVSSPTIYY